LAATVTETRSSGALRIIGGRWRGRRLKVPDLPGLRPTPDRVRETLFNWLAPRIEGARCLDLFAGTGALGLEALSRGAARVVLVEREFQALKALRAHVSALGAEGLAQVVEADALRWLERPAEPFDVVFLDPPFSRGLISPVVERLGSGPWLAPEARIYLETEAALEVPPLPSGWMLHRSRRAGSVRYHLAVPALVAGSDTRAAGDPP
jgi:16S rRNA (guanine966-N2)-methyltransferase